MKAIAQKDLFGCSLACIASITGVSYDEAKKRHLTKEKLRQLQEYGFLCKDLVGILANAGKEYSYKHLKGHERLPYNAIVFIKRSTRYPYGHYLLKTANGWMDPWRNFEFKKARITEACAGFRKRLPGKPIYAVFPR